MHDQETGETVTIDFKKKGKSLTFSISFKMIKLLVAYSKQIIVSLNVSTDSGNEQYGTADIPVGTSLQDEQFPIKQRKYDILPDDDKNKVKSLVYILNR